MNTEMTGVIVTFIAGILLSIPLGNYIARVFNGDKTLLDFLKPLERLIYKVAGINPLHPMNWKEFLKAMLTINLLWFAYAFVMFMVQGHMPLNPDKNPGMTADLSFNTAISFLVNCNLQ